MVDFSLFTSSERLVEAYIITTQCNKRYVTGYDMGDDGVVVIRGEDVYLYIDSRYTEECSALENVKVITVAGADVLHGVVESLLECGVHKIGYEANAVSHQDYLDMSIEGIELVDVSDLLIKLRCHKTQDEVASLKSACSIADKALAQVVKKIKAGITETELARELKIKMLEEGSEEEAFSTIIAFGANTSKPHAHVSNKKLEKGDAILIDFGATVGGMKSDMTRTIYFGEIAEDSKTIYKAVLQAQKTAISVIKPGMTCGEVDAIARESLKSANLEQYFTHSLGHGVGLEIHEYPYLRRGSDVVLEEGMTITVEPGVYIEGKGGVRIEDTVLVTKDGCEVLTSFNKELYRI